MNTTTIPPIYVVNYIDGVIGDCTKLFHEELSAWHYYTDIIDNYQCRANLIQMKAETDGTYSIDKVLAANDNN